ncbi:Succinylornithine transaminase/acetylornithine aminotransferase [Roseivivax sp. THAF40]|uniref:aspartate aminotransferase family protein n=1 Tax=unclassified Roseivivax TaxID=2639302 RepID=UPI0012694D75|nr:MULTISPECIES: aspartate aminotransferase family protein [unclassified Roseivivax]QFS81770.1 Succinylornithine transaminase/acetylornithine aminotransferase [Roseivivax sp. THAF197b]QFT45570.1 Succinylornithine transaminase/acetylornithine aminotransferase [Roseivivax sp. THAF40]
MIPSVLPTYNRAPLSFVKGEGSWLIEADGRRFLDLGAGIAVNALGHAHPALVEALSEQAHSLWHVSNLYRIPQQQALADALVAHTFADTVFFTNSGTESCELAVKMARKYWYDKGAPERTEIVAFSGSFHGRSSAGIAAAGSEKMTKGFGPLLPGFTHLEFGDHDALRAAVTDRTAAVLLEPVQGEGGIRPVPDHCLKGLRELCDETGALLIFDEVQCGMGRSGKLFAHEWAGIAPDIMMVAKGIGGGFPLGAVLASEAAASGMVAGTHGSTYGGNPLACAVGLKVMEIVADPAFLDDVNRRAALLRQRLEGLVAAHPDVFEGVRGSGFMLGLKCHAANTDIVSAGIAEGVLTVPAADNVVRLLPPLTLSEDEIAEAVQRLDRAALSLETETA